MSCCVTLCMIWTVSGCCRVMTAWAGDSRMVLGRQATNEDSETYMEAIELSQDHKPDNPEECKRIVEAGGRVDRLVSGQHLCASQVDGVPAIHGSLGLLCFCPLACVTHRLLSGQCCYPRRLRVIGKCHTNVRCLPDQDFIGVSSCSGLS